MEKPEQYFELESPGLTWSTRARRWAKERGIVAPTEEEPPIDEQLYELLTSAADLERDEWQRGAAYLRAGDLLADQQDWANAGGAYERAFRLLMDAGDPQVDHFLLGAVVQAGRKFERALLQVRHDHEGYYRLQAMGVHAELEHATGMEFDPVVGVKLIDRPK